MNERTIPIESTSTAFSALYSEVVLYDFTNVTFLLSGIDETLLPLYLKINWGDGNLDTIFNRFVKDYKKDNIIPEILYNKVSTIITDAPAHLYYPSSTARYKKLSAEILIEYFNGDVCSIIQPFKIITTDYFESIGDLRHLHTNIMPLTSNNKQFIFSTLKDGFLIEAET